MEQKSKEKRQLTPEEIDEARRIKSAWEGFKSQDKKTYTQGWLSVQTGLGGQSVIGQYLNGHIQLNTKAVMAFARVLNIEESQISPRMFPKKIPVAALGAITIPDADEVIKLVLLYRNCTATARRNVMRLAEVSEKLPVDLREIFGIYKA